MIVYRTISNCYILHDTFVNIIISLLSQQQRQQQRISKPRTFDQTLLSSASCSYRLPPNPRWRSQIIVMINLWFYIGLFTFFETIKKNSTFRARALLREEPLPFVYFERTTYTLATFTYKFEILFTLSFNYEEKGGKTACTQKMVNSMLFTI